MKISECNPFVRMAEIQYTSLYGQDIKIACEHRIFYVLDGCGKLIVNGKTNILSSKSLVYLAPTAIYSFDGEMNIININFDVTRNAINKKSLPCALKEEFFNKMDVFDDTVIDELPTKVIIDNGLSFEKDLLAIVEYFTFNNSFSDAITSAMLKGVLAQITTRIFQSANSEIFLAEKIYGYIKLNSTTIKSNDDVANALGYHPVYVSSVFKKVTGKNLHHTIFEERIKLSLKWLIQTTCSIEDVALKTGFSSRSHFCTVFKEHMGVSPLKYRNSQLHNK